MRRALAFAGVLWLAGCEQTPPKPAVESPQPVVEADGGDFCGRRGVLKHAALAAPHLASCDAEGCGNGQNPPAAGPHCATTLSCIAHPTAQPRCSWIHNLEHGHLVLAYNCPEGCPELVTQLQQLQTAGKRGSNGVPRVVVTPDPLLPTKVAAIVWRYSWTGDAFDADAIACVQQHQDELAPEPLLPCAGP